MDRRKLLAVADRIYTVFAYSCGVIFLAAMALEAVTTSSPRSRLVSVVCGAALAVILSRAALRELRRRRST